MIGTAPRCGAVTGRGAPCQRPAVDGGPCVWHDPVRKPAPRCWPLARRWKLMEGIERGWDDARIARELGTTATAVHLARKRYRIPARHATCLTARRVAALLGFRCAKSVVRWIEAGWLRGQRGWAVGANRAWMVREAALHDFLADPAHWHRWDPARITDAGLRAWATELRAGERFLTLPEVAARYFVQPQTVAQWIDKGWLPAVRNGNRRVREIDLAGFELPRIGGRRRRVAA